MKILTNLTAAKTKDAKDDASPIIGTVHQEVGRSWRNICLTHDDVRIVTPNGQVIIPLDDLTALAETADPALKLKK
jgi:hypothetical protein